MIKTALMVQGTTSDAGKSLLVTALCRILKDRGISVAPFKPQNMALNSAVSEDGGEIGRAQALQAIAAGVSSSVLMNPILLKPSSEIGSQLIVKGKPLCQVDAKSYHRMKADLLPEAVSAFSELQKQVDVVVIEGAGSPAEINLRQNDIANMGFAEAIDCPVILVADIERGGVFAHLYGTFALLSPSEQQRIQGFVINRFRGDVDLLASGIHWLEAKTGVKVLGVIPYLAGLQLEAEDSLAYTAGVQTGIQSTDLEIAVIKYPRASNLTDFDALRLQPDVKVTFVERVDQIEGCDLLILPGSKSVVPDLAWLREQGWESKIHQHLRYQGKVLGICGGYQMLGEWLNDPEQVESRYQRVEGLGLLPIETEYSVSKVLKQVKGLLVGNAMSQVEGYEIHQGKVTGLTQAKAIYRLESNQGLQYEGCFSDDQQVAGTFVHGLFDEPDQIKFWADWAGQALNQQPIAFADVRERSLQRLAEAVDNALDLNALNIGNAKEPAL